MRKLYTTVLGILIASAFSAQAPANDNACDAIVIDVDGSSVTSNTDNATVETDEPAPAPGNCVTSWCDGLPAENSVWFSFTAPDNGAVVVTTCLPGNNIDTQVAVWGYTACDDFSTYSLVGANDDMPGDCDNGNQYSSTLAVDGLMSGMTYLIQLDGYEASAGDIEISVATGTPQSGVNLIHNAADASAAVVDVWLNGELLIDNFEFRTATGMAMLPAGVEITIVINASNSTDDSDPIFTFNGTLDPTKNYIGMVSGIYSSVGYDPLVPVSLTLAEVPIEPGQDNFNLISFHGVTDAPAVDLVADGGITVANDLGYGNSFLYENLEAGNYTVSIADVDGNSLGLDFCLPLGFFGAGTNRALVASGFLNPLVNSNGPIISLFLVNLGNGNMTELEAGECPIPSNDNICDATEVVVDAAPVTYNNIFATAQADEPTPANLPLDDPEVDCVNQWCDGGPVENTLWFTFTAPSSGAVEITTCFGTSIDNQIALWTVGDCNDFGTLEIVAQNDDMDGGCEAGDPYASYMIVGGLTAGSTYYLQIDGWGGSTGEFDLAINAVVGISEQTNSSISAYPNPVRDNLMVSIGSDGKFRYRILDLTGKVQNIGFINGNADMINCEDLTPGMYLLECDVNDQTNVLKFVKD